MSRLLAGSATDVGLVRANNQDQFLVTDDDLFAVADGMGGHAAGEVAALTAVEALAGAFRAGERESAALLAAAKQANRAVWERAGQNPDFFGMGTTLVAMARVHAHLVGATAARQEGTGTLPEGTEPAPEAGSGDLSKLAVVHVGDSRVYRFHDGQLSQLTVDHSVVQELIDEGRIDEREASVHPRRHILTRALGVDPDVEIDLIEVDPAIGDRFVLCSDGLCREVTDEQLAEILARPADPFDLANELVRAAKEHGGSDNITVVVVDVVEGEGSVPGVEGAGEGVSLGSGRLLLGTGENEEPDTVQLPKAGPSGAGRLAQARPAGVAEPRKRARLITPRVVGFFVLLLVVIGVGVGGIGWYARSSYFVGLRSDHLTIFKGRPGGVLWFKPTVAQRTGVTVAEVLPSRLQALRAGQTEPSIGAARSYIRNLTAEANQARRVDNPSAPTKTALAATARVTADVIRR